MEPVVFWSSITPLLLPGWVQSVDWAWAGDPERSAPAPPTPIAPAAVKKDRRDRPGANSSLLPLSSVGSRFRSSLFILAHPLLVRIRAGWARCHDGSNGRPDLRHRKTLRKTWGVPPWFTASTAVCCAGSVRFCAIQVSCECCCDETRWCWSPARACGQYPSSCCLA